MENLPRYFALESLSNNKYLRFVHEDVVLQGHVEFSGEEVISIYTKFELEPAKNEAYTGLFNIRCCYNNRYWSKREKNTGWITATAAEPVEDQFNWSCTLFEPLIQAASGDGKTTLTLLHVQDNRSVPVSIGGRSGGDPTYRSCLKADANQPIILGRHGDSNAASAFSIIDWESFVILPKQVTFRNDDGLYLLSNGDTLTFASGDILSANHSHQVVYARDGSVRFFAGMTSLYPWIFTPAGIIQAQLNNTSGDFGLFWLLKGHGDNEVAIQTHYKSYKGCFFRKLADPKKSYSLEASAYSMSKVTYLRVEETVISRSVYNVKFRLKDARIYDQSDVILVRKKFSNPLDQDEAIHLIQTFTTETSRRWNSSVTLKLATPTTIKMTIPSIVDGEVDFSDEFEGRYVWGTEMKGSETTELSDHISVPARSTVAVHVIATKGKCAVPFSYMQRDMDVVGKFHINKMEDGDYTNINYYNIRAEVVKTISIA